VVGQTKRPQDATAVLKILEYDWLWAEFSADTAKISRLIDNSFVSINKSGIETKQQELKGTYESIMERRKHGHTVDSLYLDNFWAAFYDNTAVVTFLAVTSGKVKDSLYSNRRILIYDVWIKGSGQWKAVASQVTRLD
jgi:hypothetical protein